MLQLVYTPSFMIFQIDQMEIYNRMFSPGPSGSHFEGPVATFEGK